MAGARLALHEHAAVLRERRPDVVRHEARRVLRVVRAPVPARYRTHELYTLVDYSHGHQISASGYKNEREEKNDVCT